MQSTGRTKDATIISNASRLPLGRRSHFYILISGEEDRLIPMYLHVIDRDISWLNQNLDEILNDLCAAVVDNIDLIQVQAKEASKYANKRMQRMRGASISVAYTTQARSNPCNSVLVYKDDHCRTPSVIPLASFVLNPVYVFPYDISKSHALLPIESHLSVDRYLTEFFDLKS